MSQFRFKINNLVSKDFFYKNPPWMASYAYLNFESKIWHFLLKEAVAASADGVAAVDEVAIKYGDFITQTISFLVVAMVVFIIIKAINRMKEKQEAAPEAGPSSTDTLLMEIRDELKRRG